MVHPAILGDSLIERLGATGQAIRDQQEAAYRLAGALAELAMETERMVAQIGVSGLPMPVMKQEPHHGPSQKGMDMVMPGMPSLPSSVAPMVASLAPPVLKEKTEREQAEELIRDLADEAEAGTAPNPRMFCDPEELRDQIRENLMEECYDVTKLYKETGIFQAIIRNPWFEMSSTILVILSCIWMAVEIDHNESISLHESDAIFQVVAHVSCLLFVLEILVRILAFRRLRDAMKDSWVVFDLLLVMFFVIETWLFGTIAAVADTSISGSGMKLVIMLRVLRLLRIMRLARVFRVLPELMVIIRGLGRAMRAIIVVLALMGIIIFVAAILFTVLLEDTTFGQEYFPTVATSMATLMLDFTLSGARGTVLMRPAWEVHPIIGILMLLFVLLANVTMLGVLTGLLVQTVKTVAEVEKEETTLSKLVSKMDELWKAMLQFDTNGNGEVERAEFHELMSCKETARVLRALDIDVEGLANVSDFVFAQNHGQLCRKAFLQMVLDVRNNKKATVKDHIETRRFVETKLLRIFKRGNGGCQ